MFVFSACIQAQGIYNKIKEDKNVLPDSIPKLFLPGIVSTGMHEHSGFNISHDGKSALITVSLSGQKIILLFKKVKKIWDNPEVPIFSGRYRDEYPFFSPDGKKVYFSSYRPDNDTGLALQKFRHWVSEAKNGIFQPAKLLTVWHKELSPYYMDKNYTVYSWGNLKEGKGENDIYIQKMTGNSYSEPINLGDSINTSAIEYAPCLSPGGKILVFCRMGLGKEDGLYFSKIGNDGKWGKAKRVNSNINKGYAERFPCFSEDGRYLFFNRQFLKYSPQSKIKLDYKKLVKEFLSTPENGGGDIYWVDAKTIDSSNKK